MHPQHPHMVRARSRAVERRHEHIRAQQYAANSPKHALIQILSTLEAAGCASQARKLGRIIARLEAWQNRPAV